MADFVGTLLLLGIGVVIGGMGMRIIWLMSIEELEESEEEK